jgi:hypothetical protein
VRIVERRLEKPGHAVPLDRRPAFALAGGLAAASEIPALRGASPPGKAGKRAAVWMIAAPLAILAAIGVAAVAFLRGPAADDGIPVKLNVPAPQGVVQTDSTIRVSPDGTCLFARQCPTAYGVCGCGRSIRSTPRRSTKPKARRIRSGLLTADPSGIFRAVSSRRSLSGTVRRPRCAQRLNPPEARGARTASSSSAARGTTARRRRAVTLLNGVNGKRDGATLAYPTFLPDGRHLLYLDTGGGGVGEAAVYGAAVDSSDRTLVLPAAVSNAWYSRGYLFFLQNTTLVAQPFDADRMTLSGGAMPIVEQVQRPPFGPPSGAFSVSDRVLAYQTGLDARGFPTQRPGSIAGNMEARSARKITGRGIARGHAGGMSSIRARAATSGSDLRGIPTRFTSDPADEFASVVAGRQPDHLLAAQRTSRSLSEAWRRRRAVTARGRPTNCR